MIGYLSSWQQLYSTGDRKGYSYSAAHKEMENASWSIPRPCCHLLCCVRGCWVRLSPPSLLIIDCWWPQGTQHGREQGRYGALVPTLNPLDLWQETLSVSCRKVVGGVSCCSPGIHQSCGKHKLFIAYLLQGSVAQPDHRHMSTAHLHPSDASLETPAIESFLNFLSHYL